MSVDQKPKCRPISFV